MSNINPLKNQIYNKLSQVPKGKVVTYKSLAHAVNSKAYRFVGNCMKNNIDLKKVPCYKVVKSNGEIGEYSGKNGKKGKIKLLERDGVVVKNGKIDLEKFGFEFK